jgi:hypothetical protein
VSATEALLRDLIAALHKAYTEPSDNDPLSTADGRAAAYGRLREHGFTRKRAAWEVGVGLETARRYENRLKALTVSRETVDSS